MRALPMGLATFAGATGAFLFAYAAFADVVVQKEARTPHIEVVVQSGVRGEVNHCPTPDGGKQSDAPVCFFDWDAPLANLNLKLPLKDGEKCVPAKEKIAEGLDLEVDCATIVQGKGRKAYKFVLTLRDGAHAPHVVTVKLEPGAPWKFGGFKDRRRSTPASPFGAKPKRAAFLVQLKLAE